MHVRFLMLELKYFGTKNFSQLLLSFCQNVLDVLYVFLSYVKMGKFLEFCHVRDQSPAYNFYSSRPSQIVARCCCVMYSCIQ